MRLSKISRSIRKFLPQSISSDIRHLYWSALIFNFGQAMTLLFEPVYIYQLGYGIVGVILFFLFVYIGYFFLIQWGADYGERVGYEKSMFISSLVWVMYFLLLIAMEKTPVLFFVAPIFLAIQKALYWPSYHAFFARYVNLSEEGREVGTIFAVVNLTYVVAPFFAGLLINFFGYPAMFAIAMSILVASNYPLWKHRHTFVPGVYRWRRHWSLLLSSNFRTNLIAVMGYGEEFVALTVWPVFVALFVPNQLGFGLLIAVSTLVTTIITMVIGKYADSSDTVKLLQRGSFLYVGAWLSKFFVVTPIFAFVSDVWSRVAKDMITVPLSALIYEAANGGSGPQNVIETVTLHETALIVGKISAAFVSLLLVMLLPASMGWTATFAVAVLYTFLYFGYRPAK